jgi:sugar phosphate isomerase/epimerase
MANWLIGVVANALGNDPRRIPFMARTLGFDGLQFDVFGAVLNLAELSATGRREFLHLLSAQNQQLVSLRASIGTNGLGSGADVDRILSQARRALETSKALGCGVICLDLGALPAAPRTAKQRPKVTQEMAGLILLPETKEEPDAVVEEHVDQDAISQCDSALAELGKIADHIGVIVAMRSDLSSFAALDRAIGAARCPWFAIDLDPVAMLTDEWDADEIFSRLGNLVRHVRVRDAIKGQGGRRQPAAVGKGNVRWKKFIPRLDEAGYSGPLMVDSMDLTDRIAGAKAGVDILRKFAR